VTAGGMEERPVLDSDEGRVVLGLMDVLLPGGHGFPKASETGMGAMLLERLRRSDAAMAARLAAAVNAAGGPLDPLDEAGRAAAVERFASAEPKLFRTVRKLTYLTYYEQPAVIAAIRALGIRYNDSPLPDGYPAEPFAPERDAPRHERGRWVRTEEVRRVDLSRLNLEGNAP
jgi:hypothetical protein